MSECFGQFIGSNAICKNCDLKELCKREKDFNKWVDDRKRAVASLLSKLREEKKLRFEAEKKFKKKI